jgi:hypothetical protein
VKHDLELPYLLPNALKQELLTLVLSGSKMFLITIGDRVSSFQNPITRVVC